MHKTGKLCAVRVHMRWKTLNDTPFLLVSCSDMTAETHAERLLAEQTRILKQIAKHEPLDAILTSIAKAAETLRPPAVCSILLADDDGRRLYHGAAPSLPSAYIEVINGIEIGPQSGSCGAAAYQKEIVIASSVANEPPLGVLCAIGVGARVESLLVHAHSLVIRLCARNAGVLLSDRTRTGTGRYGNHVGAVIARKPRLGT
ncbi:hypothetical protein DI43_05630 [Geobacillus sp. CAMR12739]|nr:hypothetical protein DI43_05630 [Geobacillus sp. CAMR12739]